MKNKFFEHAHCTILHLPGHYRFVAGGGTGGGGHKPKKKMKGKRKQWKKNWKRGKKSIFSTI